MSAEGQELVLPTAVRPSSPPAQGSRSAAPRSALPKWHYAYFLLAIFDLFTLCTGLYATHSIMGIYRESVAVNQTWAERANAYSELGQLAAEVNAPGNDVFKSYDVDGESRRMRAAKTAFDQEFGILRLELLANVEQPNAALLVARMDAVGRAMDAMTREAQLTFRHIRSHDTGRAGERMATMDERFAEVNDALRELRHSVADMQKSNFDRQTAAAVAQQRYEHLIAALILLMVGGAMLYGHRMARHLQSAFLEKERRLAAIAAGRQALQETHERLQTLFKRTLEAQEAQHQNVAYELHEEVAQMLGSLKMRLSALPLSPATKKVKPQVEDAGSIAEDAIHRLQDVVRGLTPHGMEFVGLGAVLAARLDEWTQGSGIAVHFAGPGAGPRAPLTIETAAYRVAQSAVSNVVRHARARNLRVKLTQHDNELQLRVEDDGIGFDVASARDKAAASGMGITLMEQRTALLGGRLELVSERGAGTLVLAVLPTQSAA